MLPGPLQAGDLLAGRYLLLDPVAAEGPTVLWRAQDQVLARDVAVRVLHTSNKATRALSEPFLHAAAQAGQITHTGLVRVFDAGSLQVQRTGSGATADITYLIREWVEGEPLDEHLLRTGPLAPTDASDVLRQVADALTAAHAGGLPHGRVHPHNVLVTPSGRVRLTDAAVGAALQGEALAPSDPAAVAGDTRDAAAVLYALLTTRWPAGATPQPGDQLSPAPLSHGHPMDTHQVRAGVPRGLDHVVTQGLDPARVPTLPPLRTPQALADAADVAVAGLRRERIEQSTPRPPGFVRRHALLLIGTTVVTAVAVTGWYLGLAIGELPRRAGGVDALVLAPKTPAPVATTAAPAIDLTTLTLRDFDPQGDGQENPDQVTNAVDPDPMTAWTTSRYRGPTFGGLKTGVGLLLDLGTIRAVHDVKVTFTAPGAHVELRTADVAPTTDRDLQTVAASATGAQLVDLRLPSGTKARFLLIWITQLPKDGSGWRVGVSDLHVS